MPASLPLSPFFSMLAAMLIAVMPMAAVAEPVRGDAGGDRALLERVRRETPGPLWIRDGRPSSQSRDLLAVLHRVGDFGLSGEDFASSMATLEAAADPVDAGRFDEAMNLAVLKLMRQLHDGRIDPLAAGYELSRRRAPVDRIVM